jgi:hypothetical protein
VSYADHIGPFCCRSDESFPKSATSFMSGESAALKEWEDLVGFQLVPWSRSLAKQLGRHVSGVIAIRRWTRAPCCSAFYRPEIRRAGGRALRLQHLQSGGELGAHDVTGVTAEREHQSAEQRDWCGSGDASPGLSLACVHEDLPGKAPASSAVVMTAACFGKTMSSSIACTSASGSAQQSRATTSR